MMEIVTAATNYGISWSLWDIVMVWSIKSQNSQNCTSEFPNLFCPANSPKHKHILH